MYGYTDLTVRQTEDAGMEVFMVRPDKQLYRKYIQNIRKYIQGVTVTDYWELLDLKKQFSFGSRVAIVKDADDTPLEIFWTESNRLHHAYHSKPEPLVRQPGQEAQILQQEVKTDAQNIWYLGDPVVGRDAEGRLEVFFVGGDDSRQLYFALQNKSDKKLDLFHPLGHPDGVYWSPNRRPAVARNADGRLEVFIVGTDNILYHRWQTEPKSSSQWSDKWEPLSVPAVSDPVVAQNLDGRLEVFVIRYGDRQLYHRWQIRASDSSQWSDWVSLQTAESLLPRRRPGVAQDADGRLVVFIVGTDNQLHHRRQIWGYDSSRWSDKWETLPAPSGTSWAFSSNPVVTTMLGWYYQLGTFMIGSDKQLYVSVQEGGEFNRSTEWSTWISTGTR
jgi:hypothetical protein